MRKGRGSSVSPTTRTRSCTSAGCTSTPSPLVSSGTGTALVSRTRTSSDIVGTVVTAFTRSRVPVMVTLSGKSRGSPTARSALSTVTRTRERTATRRATRDVKRRPSVVGSRLLTRTFTPGGTTTSRGSSSKRTESVSSPGTERCTYGGVAYSLSTSRSGPITRACSAGAGCASTTVLSVFTTSRTGTISSVGWSALTTSQSTRASESAAAL